MITTTAQDLIKGALKLIGALAEAETPSADQSTDGLDRLNEFLDALTTQTQALRTQTRTTHVLTANVGSYTVGAAGDIVLARPEDVTAAAILPVGTTQEIPIALASSAAYAAIPDKTLTGTWPYAAFYDPTTPLGTLTVFPTPTTGATVVLYTRTALAQFAALTTEYTLPAGYARMLRYNLAEILAPEYGVSVDRLVHEVAVRTLADVKRLNTSIPPAEGDPRIVGIGGHYDITSDRIW